MQDDRAFTAEFGVEFFRLLRWRRDVRHFLSTPIEPDLLDELLAVTQCSPSVGYSQPWRFVSVESRARRQAVIASVDRANSAALAEYADEPARRYAQLKLSGLREAPVHLAVFCDLHTQTGKKLGTRTMPETLCYSTAMAVYTFWLAARMRGIGVGWVSILFPDEVTANLNVPREWKLVAYLAVGYPASSSAVPELVTAGWEEKDQRAATFERR